LKKKYSLLKLFIKKPEVGALTGLLMIIIFFSLSSPKFLTVSSITAMFTLASELGIIAIGASFLMISGEFDLSVGSVFALSTLIFTRLANIGVHPLLAFLLSLMISALLGSLNGIITIKMHIPSFITTLGTMMLWRGVLLYVTGGFPVSWNADKGFLYLLGGRLFAGLRITGVWFVVLTLIFMVLLNKIRYGNWVFATGGNLEAARESGVNVERVKLTNFTLCGLLAGLSGTCNLARYLISQPMLGSGMELEAIAASVIGGNLLMGGYGSILGTFLGALLMGIIRTGLIMVGVAPYLYSALTGIIVIIAVIVNTTVRRRAGG
jgi:simple sugar transport system permease protein